jgi:hypothetical protein
MGEQPMPVEDEVERALASMRAGFRSTSDKISAGLASLEEHLEDAPDEEREAVRAAIAQVINAQARLRAKMETLPAAPWDRFKAMVSAVKAQQTVLDQVGHLVKEHVLPRQLENLAMTPLPPAPAPAYEPMPQREGPSEAYEALRAYGARRTYGARRPRDDFRDEDDERRSLLSLAREWTSGFRGVAAMVLAAVFLSLVPRDIKLQDVASKLVAMVGSETESASSGVPNPRAEPEVAPPPPPEVPARRRAAEAKEPLADVGSLTDRTHPAVKAAPDQSRVTGSAPVLQDAGPETDRLDPPDLTGPREKRVAIAEPAAPSTSDPEEQFIPVVFTHKDYAKVTQALADLKQRYPNLLVGRKGTVQPVDLGAKGIWYRLAFLPAGPRPAASKLCDQLMAEGYDRCWVKEY